MGGDPEAAELTLAKRIASEIDDRGTVDVLRHGITEHGVMFHLAYFKPAHGLTSAFTTLYKQNRVTVARQFPYDPPPTRPSTWHCYQRHPDRHGRAEEPPHRSNH